jgi:predicted transcriptional regulator
MAKRNKLEILHQMLTLIQKEKEGIRTTPLIRKANLSTTQYKKHYQELQEKQFIKETKQKEKRTHITNKGKRFLERYKTIIGFIEEFEL